MNRITFILMISAALSFTSCDKESEGNEIKISSNNSEDSHNTGENCMTCHVSNGSGEGWFTAAGSVYDNSLTDIYPNATVKLTSEANGAGNLIKTIEVDQFGNFYTTEDISFGTGLFVSVYGQNGETGFMPVKITSGQCNGCHGNTNDKIWIE